MTLPIIERPLYGQVVIETLNPLSGGWTDRTQYLTGLNYSEGGRLTMPGANTVDVGQLNASFKNLPSIPTSGHFVRIRRAGTSEYAFTGYVQDVGQQIVFDNATSLTTPITVTTISCVDWVGYATQWVINGVGGRSLGFALLTTGNYSESERIRALNYALAGGSSSTQFINPTSQSGTSTLKINDTDYTGTIADHLDLISRSTGMVWYGSHVIPTNNTTGRTNLINWQASSGSLSSGKTFTDVAGTAGQLHYTQIDLESSSQNVANIITIKNRSLIRFPDIDLSRIGGANENNFIYVDLTTKQIGIIPETEWRYDDTTSQATYGARFSEIETNLDTSIGSVASSGIFYYVNLIANPSVEYTDNGYAATSANRVRRRQPSQDAVPFAAFNGDWAIRVRQRTTNTSSTINYSGGETDGIAVTAARYYRFTARVARGTPSRTDLRALVSISWYDSDETLISTSTGSNVLTPNVNEWYDVSHLALAPANTNRATVSIIFSRSGGGNLTIGDFMWIDGLQMNKTNSSGTPIINYLDGDSARGTADINVWSGEVGNSQSLLLTNTLLTRAQDIATQYASTSVRATRIRWNAQEDLTSVSAITVGKTISIVYQGTTNTYRVIGIDGELSADRYMIDYYLVKA
jgi:hypothetical protein